MENKYVYVIGIKTHSHGVMPIACVFEEKEAQDIKNKLSKENKGVRYVVHQVEIIHLITDESLIIKKVLALTTSKKGGCRTIWGVILNDHQFAIDLANILNETI